MANPTLELIQKLTLIETKLLRAFLREADPDNWIGRGHDLKELGEKQKNLRLLDKNNAKSTYAVLKAVTDRRKEMTAPTKKSAVNTADKEIDLIDELNAKAAENFKHLQSLN